MRCSKVGLPILAAFAALNALAAAPASPLMLLVEPACPSVAPPLGTQSALSVTLIEGLGKALIGTSLDAAGAYLSGAASTRTSSLRGSATAAFYQLDPFGRLSLAGGDSGCVVMLVPGDGPSRPWWDAARQRSQALRRFTGLPVFYAELAYKRTSRELSSLTLSSQLLHVERFQADGWSYKSERSYAIAVTLRSLEDGQPFAAATFEYPVVRRGTLGQSRVIRNGDSGAIEDESIDPSLNPAASAQTLPFFPVGGALQSAVEAQRRVAAPYVKAARLADRIANEPVQREPEWTIRGGTPSGELQGRFASLLAAYCSSLTTQRAAGRDLAADPRCPIEHLKAANDLEESRAMLLDQLEIEWADRFRQVHASGCKQAAQGNTVCTPPPPADALLGAVSWEVTVVETREPTVFATAVAAAFASNKDKLRDQIETEVLPSKRTAAQRAEADATRSAINELRIAMIRVEEAEAKLAEAAAQPRSMQAVLKIDVLNAKIAANAAARAAAQAEPYLP